MKRKTLAKLSAAFLAVAVSAALPLSASAETAPYERYGISKESAQYGASGYPIVVPWPDRDGYFIQPNQLSLSDASTDLSISVNTSLYELNGQVIYLSWSKQQKIALVNYEERMEDGIYTSYILYCDAEGRVRQYTDKTKPAIDAEIDVHLAQLEGNIQSLYGVSFLHRDAFSPIDNYRFAETISDCLASFPADSVRIIADTSKATTGKPLRFQSIYTDADENKSTDWWVDGTYSSDNIVQTSGRLSTTAQELGCSMEAALNTASGGRLEADFHAMNGGVAYSIYYYYDGGDLELYATVPPCFKSSYSATSFSQDFADTFSDALFYPMAELEESYRYDDSGTEYLQKVSYVKQLFNQYAGSEILQ